MLIMVECWTYSFLFGMIALNPFGGGFILWRNCLLAFVLNRQT